MLTRNLLTRNLACWTALVVAVGICSSSALATVLTFDISPDPGDLQEFTTASYPTLYGDHGAASSGNGHTYTYNGGAADTPNIGVGYGEYSAADEQFKSKSAILRTAAYTPLVNVATTINSDRATVLMLKPDAGYEVVLHSVDVGTRDVSVSGGPQDKRVEVWESIGSALDIASLANNTPLVEGTHYNVLFSEDRSSVGVAEAFVYNVTSSSILWFVLDNPTGSTTLNGYDNVHFTQQLIPEPASFALLAGGALVLVRRRR